MGRWRPPAEKSTPYITADGHVRLEAELDGLWKDRREVVAALSAAAAEGDRSENAEYIYRKKQLREMDRRIRYLQKRLPDLKVVVDLPANREQVFFGAWVTLEDETGKERTLRIVGPDEIDPAQGWISIDSPMARALLKKQLDDDVAVDTPEGRREYLLVGVSYTRPD
ncbi:MAG: transcription elongation factor GreB [Gammaproteobacteria bacterium]|nr:transcription elongation factor GreB [Gammaproteobacteria bacterium]